jgi:23S rRNA (uridine2552-2'-O)-methyltransferase
MGSQWGKDAAYVRAKGEGYRSRAVYKIQEIQDRFRVIRSDDNVVDLGAAPGSWLQVIRTLTHGKVIGIDLSPVPLIDNVLTIAGDFTDPSVQEEVRQIAGVVNVVVCDAAPKLSGQRSYDQARAIGLGLDAVAFAYRVLKPGGNFVVKSFRGEDFPRLLDEIRAHFRSARTFETTASRKGSTEVYIIAKNFRGTAHDPEGPV